MSFVERAANALWDPFLLGCFLLAGGWFTLRTGFFQLSLPTWLGATLGSLRRRDAPAAGLTQLQALSTALASTIGTGSVAGVATAIWYGGPGAVFWMWVSAFFGMMTGFVEKTLAAAYREPAPGGGFQGGPMTYMTQALPRLGRPLAFLFSLFCLLAALGGGGMVQSNSIAASLHAALGLPTWLSGAVTALLVGAVLLGGVTRVGRVSERLVPAMAALFLGGGALFLILRREALPAAFAAIWDGVVRPRAAFGGYTASAALRYGVARGVFTNEAGLGSSAMAHAAAHTDHPAREGMWGMLEVFVSTGLVCTVTALVILTSGVYDPCAPTGTPGAALSGAAFGTVFGPLGPIFVAVCLLLFAFTSLLGWGYYGERALTHLTGSSRPVPLFRLGFLAAVFLGALSRVGAVWALADLLNGLMALPNLIALILLSPKALALWRDRCRQAR